MSEVTSIVNDLFRSPDVPTTLKACIVSNLFNFGTNVKTGPNMPAMMEAMTFESTGVKNSFIFSPNVPLSKAARQIYKVGATTTFADQVDRIFDGDIPTREVVRICCDEVAVRCPSLDSSNFIEISNNPNSPNIIQKMEKTVADFKNFDIYRMPEEMWKHLEACCREEFGKKKQISRAQQQVAQA